MTKSDKLRKIPAVEKVLQTPALLGLAGEREIPRTVLIRAVRETLEELRKSALAGGKIDTNLDAVAGLCALRAEKLNIPAMRRVINAAGIVLHTNLGRAPLAKAAIEAMKEAAGYCNLEYDLEKGSRGHRHDLVAGLLGELTGAEAALVVNNNAAAVLLVLGALARGREVIVSRGELVEIGGAFRIPEVMAQSGAVLREVGSTNKTRLADYEAAIGPDTAMLLKVHTSNYRVLGFTEEVTLENMTALGKKYGLITANDLGSGLFFDVGATGGDFEPSVFDTVATGADIVTFSGDKLLGGPQAGIIVGSEAAVGACRKHPLMRALRPDKVTLAALEATLRLYRDPERAKREIPALRMMLASEGELKTAAERIAVAVRGFAPRGVEVSVISETSEAGGGSLPLACFPTWAVAIELQGGGISKLEETLRRGSPPVIARVKEDALLIDPRTLLPGEEEEVIKALEPALNGGGAAL
ncbi:L-seryl-tRNA(Sec) selenium transferase [bacterium]|nr:MAG: L-seryl-tRNA(Sec) selenium transferase [bacterium]